MRLPKSLLFVTVALLSASALASEEGALRLRQFRFEALDKSGPIIVSGTQSDTGIDRLRIDAFGKSYTLTRSHLEQLRGLIMNGAQLSSEGGYAELGGRTIYLVLSMGFTDGIAKSKLVTLTERGDIHVEDGRPH
jgi:hypothetical protein